jgi:hypothetical protein
MASDGIESVGRPSAIPPPAAPTASPDRPSRPAASEAGPAEPSPAPADPALGDLGLKTYARWTVDPKTHVVRIQVLDASTGKVVESVPPESYADWARENFGDSAGTLLDSRT